MLCPLLLLALSASAKTFTLPLTPVSNRSTQSFSSAAITAANSTRLERIRAADQARAGRLARRNQPTLSKLAQTIATTNEGLFYSVSVQVGGQSYEVLVDTGSSSTWVQDFRPTHSTQQANSNFSISYGSGSASGVQILDDMAFASDLVAKRQSFGAALRVSGIEVGLLGVGPLDLTNGTLTADPSSTVPTIVDTLFAQGSIEEHSLGIFFAPSLNMSNSNGRLTFGGIENDLVQKLVLDASRSQSFPASEYWSVDMSFALGSTLFGPRTAGIVDTGTTLILMASDYADAYAKLLLPFGAELDSKTGLVRMPSDSVSHVPDLHFGINSKNLTLIGDAQFFPEEMNEALEIPDGAGFRYSVVSDLGAPSGQGLDFIFGMKALERYATLYDSTRGTVSFYETDFTNASFAELDVATTSASTPAFTLPTSIFNQESDKTSSALSPAISSLLALLACSFVTASTV